MRSIKSYQSVNPYWFSVIISHPVVVLNMNQVLNYILCYKNACKCQKNLTGLTLYNTQLVYLAKLIMCANTCTCLYYSSTRAEHPCRD